MDYEKLYNEAIERAKKHCADYVVETIFPELAESEDEKIRKAIGYAIGQSTHSDGTLINGVSSEEALAWLEKQGEHAKFRDSIQVGDKVTRNQDGVLVNLSQLKRVAKPTGKVEPKFKIGDIIRLKDGDGLEWTVEGVLNNGYYTIVCADRDDFIQLDDKWELVEQKPAWSEYDEGMLDKVIKRLHKHLAGDKEYLDIYYWLIALKDRVQPKPKQEWSQNDIDMIDWLIRCCEKEHEELCNDKYGHQDIVSDLKRDCRKKWNWLESLKNKVVPQNRWKPSDEQMKLLREVQQALLGKDCHNRFVNFMYELKRLSEE